MFGGDSVAANIFLHLQARFARMEAAQLSTFLLYNKYRIYNIVKKARGIIADESGTPYFYR